MARPPSATRNSTWKDYDDVADHQNTGADQPAAAGRALVRQGAARGQPAATVLCDALCLYLSFRHRRGLHMAARGASRTQVHAPGLGVAHVGGGQDRHGRDRLVPVHHGATPHGDPAQWGHRDGDSPQNARCAAGDTDQRRSDRHGQARQWIAPACSSAGRQSASSGDRSGLWRGPLELPGLWPVPDVRDGGARRRAEPVPQRHEPPGAPGGDQCRRGVYAVLVLYRNADRGTGADEPTEQLNGDRHTGSDESLRRPVPPDTGDAVGLRPGTGGLPVAGPLPGRAGCGGGAVAAVCLATAKGGRRRDGHCLARGPECRSRKTTSFLLAGAPGHSPGQGLAHRLEGAVPASRPEKPTRYSERGLSDDRHCPCRWLCRGPDCGWPCAGRVGMCGCGLCLHVALHPGCDHFGRRHYSAREGGPHLADPAGHAAGQWRDRPRQGVRGHPEELASAGGGGHTDAGGDALGA